MNLDRVSAGTDVPNDCNVVVEIPMHGEPIKYEVDKAAGAKREIADSAERYRASRRTETS